MNLFPKSRCTIKEDSGQVQHFICAGKCDGKHQDDFCYSYDHARSLGWVFYHINSGTEIYAKCPECEGKLL